MKDDLDPARLADFERRLLAHPGVRVDEQSLWRAFAEAFPGRPQPPEERRWMMAALQHLSGRGVLRLPAPTGRRWDRSAGLPVPRGVDLVRPTGSARQRAWRTFPWHPTLQWVTELPSITEDTQAFLLRVHDGLVQGRFSERAPLKYRSLELTGDEKRLGALAQTQLFGPGRLSLDLLGCLPEVLPLAWARVGSRPHMIVFENAAPFVVARDVLASMPDAPYGLVAFGWGARFQASLTGIPRIGCAVERISYVGDIDAAGLSIAVSSQKNARALGLPPLEPASGVHGAMLGSAAAFGQASGWPAKRGAPDATPDSLLAFLPPEIRLAVRSILAAGRRIPEEVLGPNELRALWGRNPLGRSSF